MYINTIYLLVDTAGVGGGQWCLLQTLTPLARQLLALLGASTGGGAAVARLHNSGNTPSLQALN